MNDELCERLRAAAFHGGAAEPELLARGAAGPPLARWLTAVALGAQGRYAAAYALLEPLSAIPGPVLPSLACSTLASHRRQLGGHAEARRWDAAAVRRAAAPVWGAESAVQHARRTKRHFQPLPPDAHAGADVDGVDGRGALADALLGLAADALAVGRLAEARVLAARAEAPAQGSWRTAVRFGWVSAELALAAGKPAAALAPAEAAAKLAREAGAGRHAVKSDIVLAVALSTAGDESSRAEHLLRESLNAATKHGWRSLTWPAAFAAAHDDQDLREYADAVLHGVLQATDPAGREIASGSPWVPKFGSGPV